ncbi:FecR protein [Chitinophaga dinghuensis]|uniref:FecR protein n=1 Tax=Chitinophaga dinghuensis TaxID=1539050 RepID=A0A327WBU6_9BACT|nr:FecR family protein [Chitinophaga dinghuensis]RAJ88063.1 FecR protein [Chitinophaga dinghuensis]
MTREELFLLAEKVASGTASDMELMQYNQVFHAFRAEENWNEALLGNKQEMETAIRKRLQPILEKRRVPNLQPFYKWAAAAMVAAMMTTGYFYFRTERAVLAPQAERFHNDIPAPAGNHAVLTLSNGRQILLDSASNGLLAQQGTVTVSMAANGQIIYNGTDQVSNVNTVQVPQGSRPLAMVLSDGTKVWIDAGSSLTYPTVFTGKSRVVTVTGQAFFDVTPNSHEPFLVKNSMDSSTVDVLGTSFNIRAFHDEHIVKLTLLDGAVKFNTTKTTQLLHPGQQAAAAANGAIQLTAIADLKAITAWKEGLFYFNGTDIPTIMSELQRYYNVEVVYQTDVRDFFVAKIPRDVPVSQLLNLLEMTNLVHFKIDGRRITVIK